MYVRRVANYAMRRTFLHQMIWQTSIDKKGQVVILTAAERDRVLVTTNDFLRTVREAINQTQRAVDVGVTIAMSGEGNGVALSDAQQSLSLLCDGIMRYVSALDYYHQTETGANEERVDAARKARGTASFVLGDLTKSINLADSAGAWMMVKGAYDAFDTAKKAQTVAWNAEQAISK